VFGNDLRSGIEVRLRIVAPRRENVLSDRINSVLSNVGLGLALTLS